jgi:hypothetical protein
MPTPPPNEAEKDSEAAWTCKVCTLSNCSDALVCDMCRTLSDGNSAALAAPNSTAPSPSRQQQQPRVHEHEVAEKEDHAQWQKVHHHKHQHQHFAKQNATAEKKAKLERIRPCSSQSSGGRLRK